MTVDVFIRNNIIYIYMLLAVWRNSRKKTPNPLSAQLTCATSMA